MESVPLQQVNYTRWHVCIIDCDNEGSNKCRVNSTCGLLSGNGISYLFALQVFYFDLDLTSPASKYLKAVNIHLFEITLY